MSARLNLTDEQKAKVRPILEDEVKQIMALRANTSLPPADRQAKVREIRQSTRQQIDQILTPEQKARRRENARQRREERREGPPQP